MVCMEQNKYKTILFYKEYDYFLASLKKYDHEIEKKLKIIDKKLLTLNQENNILEH